ncbi:MAG: hypothetical protein EOO82_00455 [Oxalobacteraceae bacterium]|nr:MAG: hypothetical protein EOO82_00455 [Oxalobacteraceae bacterium]
MQKNYTADDARNARSNIRSQVELEQQRSDLRGLEGETIDLCWAVYVMETLVEFEFEAGTVQDGTIFPCKLNDDQLGGIIYMSAHVRLLSRELERKFQAATERADHDAASH